jgi:hypothetical protein
MKHFALAAIFAAASVLTLGTAAPAHAQGQGNVAGITVPVTGTGPGGTFAGDFTLQRFVATADGLVAVGRLVGTVTNTATGVTRTIVRNLVVPVTVAQAACDILNLELGPLDLNLLGLEIHLDQIVLDITAQPGAGNLLGNLLCSVAGLLDNPGGLAKVLNQILSILG